MSLNRQLLHPRNLWRWLTMPFPGRHESELRRRSGLLLRIVLVLIALMLVSLALGEVQLAYVTDPTERYSLGVVYPPILWAALVCFLASYVLARTGHNMLSGVIVAAVSMMVPWVMVLLTKSGSSLYFSVPGVILASFLLSRRATLAILAFTVVAPLSMPLLVPGITSWEVTGVLRLVLAVGVLSLVSARVHDRDLKQIDEQTRALVDNQERIIGARKTEAIARLSAGIAHEFNNIAMGIVGYAELIASQPAERAGKYAELIKSAGMRAGRLTAQLLSFSRQQLLNPRVTDLNGLVAGLEHSLRSMLNEGIRLAVHLDPKPKIAYVDPELIEQVVRALLCRAIGNVRGGGEVVVRTQVGVAPQGPAPASSRSGRYCAITISDSGPPASAEALARVFDPFFTEGEFGSGDLDLAAAYGIVAQSEGRIEVANDPGGGNTFAIVLPETQGSPLARGPDTLGSRAEAVQAHGGGMEP